MDGVVIDSNPLHREVWTEYNRQHGIETTAEMRARITGKRNDEVVRDFFGAGLSEAEILAHGRQKEALYRALMRERLCEAIVPGLPEFLGWWAGKVDIGLVTNAEPANVDFVLDGAGLRRYFPVVVTGEDVALPKPHPAIYLRAAETLGHPPDECLVFEDSPTGVAAAVAAGMTVVGLATTEASLDGAQMMIRDFRDSELEKWLSSV
jgi:beta-phosphoglucomutase-like phosphatase (HAD superfamily)